MLVRAELLGTRMLPTTTDRYADTGTATRSHNRRIPDPRVSSGGPATSNGTSLDALFWFCGCCTNIGSDGLKVFFVGCFWNLLGDDGEKKWLPSRSAQHSDSLVTAALMEICSRR